MITKKKIKNLAQYTGTPCLSIYIPTYRSGHAREDQIRFKNALSEAQAKLQDHGMDEKAAHRFLAEAYQMLDDEDFWRRLSDGLAVFLSEGYFEYYLLPVDVNPFVWVGQQFYIRPMLPALTGKQRFFLLALSQNEVRFFEGNKHSISPVIIEDLVPADMETALALDVEGNQLQAHTSGKNAGSSIFHGNAPGSDHKVKRLRQYFQLIDNGLMKMLHDEDCPLVIAAVDYLVPIYKEVSRYTNIADVHISGNPEHDDPVLLHEKAWVIIDTFNQNKLAELKEEFPDLLANQKATTELSTIVRAAKAGRIDTLFLNKNQHIWGAFDAKEQSIELTPQKKENSETDLLELAAKETFLQQGKVYQVAVDQLPDGKQAANAILRY